MDKLLVASEYTEPSAFNNRILDGLEEHSREGKFGLLLITKRPSRLSSSILEVCDNLKTPVVIHCTVTGFAGTVLEPNLDLDWKYELTAGRRLLSGYDCVKDIVLRIDPLIPYYTTRVSLLSIAREAKVCGFRRCRVSVLDYYPHVRDKFGNLGLKYSLGFQPEPRQITDLLREAVKACMENSISVESCAEPYDMPGLKRVGCANRGEWSEYGLELGSGRGQRADCFCNTPKIDLLPKEPTCPINCLYCYWGKNR